MVGPWASLPHDYVFAVEAKGGDLGAGPRVDIASWIDGQQKEEADFREAYADNVARRADGVLVWAQAGAPTRILVPSQARESLVKKYHVLLEHPGPRRTQWAIEERFLWPGLAALVARLVKTWTLHLGEGSSQLGSRTLPRGGVRSASAWTSIR